MSITIREASEADLEDILALYESIEENPQLVLSLEEARAMLAQFSRYPSYRLWVACDAASRGAVVGSYALLVMHNLAHRARLRPLPRTWWWRRGGRARASGAR
ncbi:hypothetical protein [Acidovorax carolinensis]|uniref:hypothetical protein n=1 Tax=Acidovorax carolinensis TaxID=553814 RepID=UPI0030029772